MGTFSSIIDSDSDTTFRQKRLFKLTRRALIHLARNPSDAESEYPKLIRTKTRNVTTSLMTLITKSFKAKRSSLHHCMAY